MSQVKTLEYSFALQSFLNEVQKEYVYQKNGGTSYRETTAELSLHLAHQVNDFVPFLDRDRAKTTVETLRPELDKYRKEDMAKFLYYVAKDLNGNATLSQDVLNYVNQKRKNRRPLSFVKV
ncbi:hypothetical protein [Fictibacillus sp. NRS-1165]|uniref:hypothetical protein n=1 Tax=Fictibacillus sp. NRS-1165 TaxID=3144463 RepID=UPI003D1A33FA